MLLITLGTDMKSIGIIYIYSTALETRHLFEIYIFHVRYLLNTSEDVTLCHQILSDNDVFHDCS